MKRLLIHKYILLFLTVLASAFFFSCSGCSGCDKKQPENEEGEKKEITLSLDKSRAAIILGDELWIKATYTETDGETLIWSSDNDAVASVVDGKVSANSVGNATIKATYADKTAECSVSVTTDGMLPVIAFEGIPDGETVSVSLMDRLNLNPSVRFNGKTFNDGAFEFSVSDGEVGSVDNGIFVPGRVGETTVSIQGKWRGIEGACLFRTVTVKVINDVSIVVNGGMTSSIVLYTTESHGGIQYDTSSPFVVSAKENGTNMQYEVKIGAGVGIVSYDAVSETVSAITYGDATITIEFTDSEGLPGTLDIPVTVRRPVADYADTVQFFSAVDGEIPVEEIFGKTTDIVDAYCDGTELTVDGNKIKGITTERTRMTEQTVVVYDENVGYRVNLQVYSKVIGDESDFSYFNSERDGYIVLKNDIICSGTTTVSNTGIFVGVFDGLGHTIKNIKVSVNTGSNPIAGGLFGVLGSNAVIKNLGITDADLSAWNAALLAGDSRSQYGYGATVENLYVSVAKAGARPGMLMWARGPWDKINNVIVDLGNAVLSGFNNAYGALFAQDSYAAYDGGRYWPQDNANITNVYVVDGTKVPLSNNSVYNPTYPAIIYAANDGISEDASAKTYVYTGVTRYADMFALAGSVNKVGDGENYWTISETGVEWKGTLPEFETVEYDGVVEFSALDGDLPVEDIFGRADVVITEAYQGGTSLTVSGNKVLGVATKSNEVTVTKIVVCSAVGKYSVTLNAYTKIIDEESDFSAFDVTDGTVTGYYVLKSDVICGGEIEWKNVSTDKESKYFDGVFDGRGYKVVGLRVGEKGLFGTLGNNAVIKNVAFTRSILSDVEEWKYTPFIAFESLAANGSQSSIENVYIEFANFRAAKSGNRGAGLIFIYNSNIMIKNVIVEIKTKNLTPTPQYGYGALFEEDRIHGSANNLVNVFVVSELVPLAMHVGVDLTSGVAAYSWAVYAGNDRETSGKLEKETYYYYDGVSRYDDLSAFALAKDKVGNWKIASDGITWEE